MKWLRRRGIKPQAQVFDNVLDRISFDPGSKKNELNPIPWPEGFAPQTVESQELPSAVDVLVITWTAAEARALADVLTPDVQSTEWNYYKDNFQSYMPDLTGRSPARESRRLGSWWITGINGKTVVCFKSELHPATDGPTVPTTKLVNQLIGACNPGVIITTGTAGGAGDGTLLGDINIASAVHADFSTKLKNWPNAATVFPTTPLTAKNMSVIASAIPLFAANEMKIPSQSRAADAWTGHTVSTDFFAFDTETDYYGLRKYDPAIRAVEMDDAAVLAANTAGRAVYSVRNASDPVMPGKNIKADDKNAADIYQKYGYWTTVNSAIGTWALIAGME
jgi:nucleoside phosphorylase